MSLGLLLALSPLLYLLHISPLLGLHGLALCLNNGFFDSSAQLEVHFLLQAPPPPATLSRLFLEPTFHLSCPHRGMCVPNANVQ